MAILDNILSKLLEIQKKHKLEFTIHFGNIKYALYNVMIFKSDTSLTRPSVKGGIYYSDIDEFKIKGTSDDLAIMPLLSKCMLGPNHEFMELKVTAKAIIENLQKNFTFFVYVTNTMQRSTSIELTMRIIQVNF